MDGIPTIPVPKIVGSLLTSEWFASQFVTFLTDFISIDMNFRGIELEGDLSEWIKQYDDSNFLKRIIDWRDWRHLFTCVEFLNKLRSPSGLKELMEAIEALHSREPLEQAVRIAYERGNFQKLRSHLALIASKAGLPGLEALECCKLLRATQTTMRSLVWYRLSPLKLITRARLDDQEALLDLVRIDRLFLVDTSLQSVIRSAVLADDKSFVARLGRLRQPAFGRRQACEFYFYTLAVLGLRPPLHRLRLAIDPEGKAFPRLYDYESCFERRVKEVSS